MKLIINYHFYETSIIVIIIINLQRPHWRFIAPVVGMNVWLLDEHHIVGYQTQHPNLGHLGFKLVLLDDRQSAFVTIRVF